MCKQCWEAVSKHYPHLTREERHELLWGATAFPAGGPDIVERQLIDLKQRTDGSLGAALALAEEELEREMNKAVWPTDMLDAIGA